MRRRCMPLRVVQPVLRNAHGGIGVPLRPQVRPPRGFGKNLQHQQRRRIHVQSADAGQRFSGRKHLRQHGHVRNQVSLVPEFVVRSQYLSDRVRQVHREFARCTPAPPGLHGVLEGCQEEFVRFAGQVDNPIHAVVRIRRIVVVVLIGRVVVGQGPDCRPPGRTAGHRCGRQRWQCNSRGPVEGPIHRPFHGAAIRSCSCIFGVAMATLLLPPVAGQHRSRSPRQSGTSVPGRSGSRKRALPFHRVGRQAGPTRSRSRTAGRVAVPALCRPRHPAKSPTCQVSACGAVPKAEAIPWCVPTQTSQGLLCDGRPLANLRMISLGETGSFVVRGPGFTQPALCSVCAERLRRCWAFPGSSRFLPTTLCTHE